MNKDLMFSSKTCEWSTPQKLIDAIKRYVTLDIDVCATVDNAKCEKYFTIEQDGLKQDWQGFCWMNPPYGRVIKLWIKKAYYESRKDNTVVLSLLPARTDTSWWHDYVISEPIIYFRGRLKFGGHKNCAPFPSALALLGGPNWLKALLQYKLTEAGIPCF